MSAKKFERAQPEVVALVKRVLEEWHPLLKESDVTVGVVMVGDKAGPVSLSVRGHPAAASIRVTPPRDRALGHPDTVMQIDAFTWARLEARQREALIDHELTHVQVLAAAKGGAKEDRVGRPRLRLRYHDVELGLFYDVAERWGADAIEAITVRHAFVVDERGQYFLPGFVLKPTVDDLHKLMKGGASS